MRREINFCKKVNLNIIGMVENMSGFICPHCAECTALFSVGGGENLAKDLDIQFLGRVPNDPTLTTLMEKERFCDAFPKSQIYQGFQDIVNQVEKAVGDIASEEK